MIRRSSRARARAKLVQEADQLVRKLVLARDGECNWCGRREPEVVLQAAHVKTKGRYSRLRHELLNVMTLCVPCHLFRWHKDPHDALEWFHRQFPGRIEHLEIMAATAPKVDLKELIIGLRLEVEALK